MEDAHLSNHAVKAKPEGRVFVGHSLDYMSRGHGDYNFQKKLSALTVTLLKLRKSTTVLTLSFLTRVTYDKYQYSKSQIFI
jgi:hypothetical protein